MKQEFARVITDGKSDVAEGHNVESIWKHVKMVCYQQQSTCVGGQKDC